MNEALEQAHRARREKADAAIWEHVARTIEHSQCRCDLRPGMTRDDLPSGSGCKTNFICPALDTYRRLLPAPPIPEDERALQESA